jgi:hypothetical protein
MKGKYTIIATTGVISEAELNEPPSLATLRAGVGGFIEVVPMFDLYKDEHCVCFCNEEGKLMGLPINISATELWHKQRHPHPIDDVLCGDVIIIRGDNELMEAL